MLGQRNNVKSYQVIEPSTSTRRGSAVLVTGSPHKNAVEAAVQRKEQKEAANVARKEKREHQTKTSAEFVSSDEEDEEMEYVSTDDDSGEVGAECPICKKCFSQDNKGTTELHQDGLLVILRKCRNGYDAAHNRLELYECEEEAFLCRIITLDGTWTKSYEPQLKLHSNE
ncbi:hypothetical protein C0J52_27138 [Blattella germanica]|nr:hypothetical protein C0J52_27138 [Blattella germanica]